MKHEKRLVVQLTGVQKRAISRRARQLGMSRGNLMRQAAESLARDRAMEGIEQLLDRVNASTRQANDALNEALSSIDESNRRITAMERQRDGS